MKHAAQLTGILASSLVLVLIVRSSLNGSRQGLPYVLEESSSFPGIHDDVEHIYAREPGEGQAYVDELTPEQQAAMQLQWQHIMNETDTQLQDQIARGEAADLALHKAGGFVAGRNADVGMWRDVQSPDNMVKRKGSYVSIKGDSVPYEYLAPPLPPCPVAAQAASGCANGGVQMSVYIAPQVQPVAVPVPAFLPIDRQLLKQESRISQEDKLEVSLRRQVRKVRALRRRLLAQRGSADKDPLWTGVHLTQQDLEPESKRQQAWEAHLWRSWDRENKRSAVSSHALRRQLDATRVVAAAGRSTQAQDRANQDEISEISSTSGELNWEKDPSLHYRDLGPDGRPTRLRDSLVFVHTKRKPNPYCAFCGGASGGDKAGAVGGKKVFTEDDWNAALKGSDFVNTYPNTDDLRVLDWLAADKSSPHSNAKDDSMSSKGAQVDLPDDWNDFPKAKGTYTAYGVGYW